MAYEKPELLVLSFAGNAVRGAHHDSSVPPSSDKAAQVHEGTSDNTDANHSATTSSTSGAYEADE